MLNWLRRSLPVRAGLAVATIAILTLTATFSAAIITWRSQGDAAAINMAGSLRMAAFRLAWKLERGVPAEQIAFYKQDLERRLNSPQLNAVLSVRDTHASLNQHHRALFVLWENTLKPVANVDDHDQYGERVDAFVDALDGFVLALQHDSENRQKLLQVIQGLAMVITVLILLVGMRDMLKNVVWPLKELMRTAERYRAGDQDARARRTTDDELGQLVTSFNAMADAVSQSQLSLQNLLGEKSALLSQSRAALQLLHHSAHTVAGGAARADSLNRLVQDFRQTLSGLDVTLCLDNMHIGESQRLVVSGGTSLDVCNRQDCNACERIPPPRALEYPIMSQGKTLGRLHVRFSGNRPADAWEEDLIRTLADLIGTALTLQQQREQDRLLVLQEERAVIARELHDSLAQALSYIKLQISRLQRLVELGASTEQLIPVTEDIREGVNSAYRQLRELLTTFRLKMSGSDLPSTLTDTLAEFSSRGDLPITLDLAPLPCPLSASEEIHILQIVREALSNCVRHAKAQHAQVRISLHGGRRIRVEILDDGQGFTPPADNLQHHGLTIMRERAHSLGGEIHVARRAEGGTQVHLDFEPVFLRKAEPEKHA